MESARAMESYASHSPLEIATRFPTDPTAPAAVGAGKRLPRSREKGSRRGQSGYYALGRQVLTFSMERGKFGVPLRQGFLPLFPVVEMVVVFHDPFFAVV